MKCGIGKQWLQQVWPIETLSVILLCKDWFPYKLCPKFHFQYNYLIFISVSICKFLKHFEYSILIYFFQFSFFELIFFFFILKFFSSTHWNQHFRFENFVLKLMKMMCWNWKRNWTMELVLLKVRNWKYENLKSTRSLG